MFKYTYSNVILILSYLFYMDKYIQDYSTENQKETVHGQCNIICTKMHHQS